MNILDELVASGDIASYSLAKLDENGNVVVDGAPPLPLRGMRETERATLTFPSGKQLVIDTFCSGCLENTSLLFSENNEPTIYPN
jgi:hypothetical protein